MERVKLEASPRTGLGKQKVRKLKAQGFLPAVIYGRGMEPTPLSVSTDAIRQLLKTSGNNALLELTIEGMGPVTAMVKKIMRSPVTLEILNVDFHRVASSDRVHARVPIEYVGIPVGVTVGGGSLLKPVSDLEIIAVASELPSSIQADVSNLDLGDGLHVRDLVLPEGVEIVAPPDEVVAVVHAPHGAVAEEEAAEGEATEATE